MRLLTDNLSEAERLVDAKLGAEPFDLQAMACIANVFRAATAFRNRVERELLSDAGVSWSGFVALFVLWTQGPCEAQRLAHEVGVVNATLTGLASTLERRGFVERLTPRRDRRKSIIALTPEGTAVIEELFPRFHAYEVLATDGISHDDQRIAAGALRTISRWSESAPD